MTAACLILSWPDGCFQLVTLSIPTRAIPSRTLPSSFTNKETVSSRYQRLPLVHTSDQSQGQHLGSSLWTPFRVRPALSPPPTWSAGLPAATPSPGSSQPLSAEVCLPTLSLESAFSKVTMTRGWSSSNSLCAASAVADCSVCWNFTTGPVLTPIQLSDHRFLC